MHIGKKIKDLTVKKNLTAPALGRALGISKQAIYNLYEKEDVNTKLLKQVADELGVPLSIFFEEDENKTEVLEQNGGKQNIQNKAGGDVNIGVNMAERDELVRLRTEVKFLKEIIADKDERIAELKERIDELKGKK